MKTVKLRKVGDSYIFIIPKELKEKYKIQNREEI
jgi:bifunctional DNA-binding transcriptional regulator/antitoxin component of YhaV-PrlF toxin-antitoxin module